MGQSLVAICNVDVKKNITDCNNVDIMMLSIKRTMLYPDVQGDPSKTFDLRSMTEIESISTFRSVKLRLTFCQHLGGIGKDFNINH